jgi:hypothetical protein
MTVLMCPDLSGTWMHALTQQHSLQAADSANCAVARPLLAIHVCKALDEWAQGAH